MNQVEKALNKMETKINRNSAREDKDKDGQLQNKKDFNAKSVQMNQEGFFGMLWEPSAFEILILTILYLVIPR